MKTRKNARKDVFGIDWGKCINWDVVDNIVKHPEKEENKKIIEILKKMK